MKGQGWRNGFAHLVSISIWVTVITTGLHVTTEAVQTEKEGGAEPQNTQMFTNLEEKPTCLTAAKHPATALKVKAGLWHP